MYLEKRDNMGYLIPPLVIVLLVVLGAFLLAISGYAVNRLLGITEAPNGYRARTVEQDDYMREVRHRNLNGLIGKGRWFRQDGPSSGRSR